MRWTDWHRPRGLPRRASRATRWLASGIALTTAGMLMVTLPAPAAAASGCPRPPYGRGISAAPGSGKTVALTFDDGPSEFTPRILAILRSRHVRATFFQTGAHEARYPQYARQVVAAGMLVAVHSWDHYYPREVRGGWSRGYITSQITRTATELKSLTGATACFFRPPGGSRSTGMWQAASERRMTVVMWSVSAQDWQQGRTNTAAWVNRIVHNATNVGGKKHPIVLMHDGKASHEPEAAVSSNRGNDMAALPKIIDWYRAHGYRFVDLNGRS